MADPQLLTNDAAPAAVGPTMPHRADPPFRDLIDPAIDPPPFDPLAEPRAEAEAGTWWDRQSRKWAALPPRRQRMYVGGAVIAIAGIVFAWPTSTSAEAPFPSQPDQPPKVIRLVDEGPTKTVPALMVAEIRVKKNIALNTQITPQNFDEFFEVRQVERFPFGGVRTPAALYGKFARRAHAATELAKGDGFGDQIVPDVAWIEVLRQDVVNGTEHLTAFYVYTVPGERPVRVFDPPRAEEMRLPAAKELLVRMIRGERFPGINLTPAATP